MHLQLLFQQLPIAMLIYSDVNKDQTHNDKDYTYKRLDLKWSTKNYRITFTENRTHESKRSITSIVYNVILNCKAEYLKSSLLQSTAVIKTSSAIAQIVRDADDVHFSVDDVHSDINN